MLRWRAALVTSRSCCAMGKTTGARTAGGGPLPAALKHGRRGFAGLIFPSAILVLMPKCPACIAAYLAIGTGIGLSLPVATYLRLGILILCVLSLVYFGARCARGLLRQRRPAQ
jgi:hypothetical protein